MYDRRRVRCIRRPGVRVYIPTGWTPPERRERPARREDPDIGTDRHSGSYIGFSRRSARTAQPAHTDTGRTAGTRGERFRKHTRQTSAAGNQNGHGRFHLRHSRRSRPDAPAAGAPAVAAPADIKAPPTTGTPVSRDFASPLPPQSYDGAMYPPYYPPAVPVILPAYSQPYRAYDRFHSMLTDDELARLSEAEDYEDRYGRDFDRYAD